MAFCEVESDIDRDFDFGVASDDGFSMNLMTNENITWTVERERGMSFDLTALTDPDSESRHLDGVAGGGGGAFLDVMRREVKLEAAESGVKETTFGHPFGGQFRPQPRPAPPSPFSRGAQPVNKRMLPPSFDLRAPSSTKKRQQQQQQQQPWDSGVPQHQQEEEPTPRALGRTRSRSVRPSSAPKAAAAAAQASTSAASAAPGRSKSGGGSRVKVEAAEARRSATSSVPRRRHVGGIDTMALTAELGLVDSRRRCGGGGGGGRHRNNGAGNKGPPHRVGAYTLEERAVLVAKFHAKRGRRIWRKKIKYSCRKKLADKRPRLKGRFVTQEELEGLDKETLAKVTGLGPWPDETSDGEDEAGEASDSGNSECYSGPAAATPSAAAGTGRYRGGAGAGGDRESSAGSRSRKKTRTKKAPLCTAVAAAAAAAAAVKATDSLETTSSAGGEDEDEVELDLEDGGSSTSAISSEDGASVCGADEYGGVGGSGDGGRGMDRVSSSCKVSDMFAVRTDADVSMEAEDLHQHQQQQEESYDEDDDDDSEEVRVDEFEPTDPVFGFMVDDVLSSSFNVVPGGDMEGMSTVAVS